MSNRGMLALAEWHGSHEEEEPAKAEEGEFWDNVSGVPLKVGWVRKPCTMKCRNLRNIRCT